MRRHHCGFTLLELLVALAVFAVMSVMAYGGLRTLLDAREQSEQRAERFSELQQTFLFLQQDLGQAVDRKVRDELGSSEPAFSGGIGSEYLFRLTRVATLQGKPVLQRVAFRFEGDKLQRLRWSALDSVQGSEPIRMDLMGGLQDIRIRFLGEEWEPNWAVLGSEQKGGLPRAVEIIIVTPEWGEIRRLFPVYP